MATLPTIPSLPVGSVVEAADMNALSGCCTFLMNKPYARVRAVSTATSLGTGGTYANMAFDTEDFDDDNMWVVGHPSRLTVQTPGWFKFRYSVVSTSTSLVSMAALQSTTGVNNPGGSGNTFGLYWGSDATGTAGADKACSGGGLWPFYLYIGDYVEVMATSSGSETLQTALGASASYFSAEFISMELG